MNPEFLFSKFSDISFDYNAILSGSTEPTNFNVSETGFTWDGDDKAAGYLIYKDGVFVDMTSEPSYTKDAADNATYTVKSISRHGVTSDAVEAKEGAMMLAFPTAEGFGKYTSGAAADRWLLLLLLPTTAPKELCAGLSSSIPTSL